MRKKTAMPMLAQALSRFQENLCGRQNSSGMKHFYIEQETYPNNSNRKREKLH